MFEKTIPPHSAWLMAALFLAAGWIFVSGCPLFSLLLRAKRIASPLPPLAWIAQALPLSLARESLVLGSARGSFVYIVEHIVLFIVFAAVSIASDIALMSYWSRIHAIQVQDSAEGPTEEDGAS